MKKMKTRGCMAALAFAAIVLIASLFTRNAIEAALINDRRREAETMVQVFCKNLMVQLENSNYAADLSYTLEQSEHTDVALFEKKAEELLKSNEHIVYLSYFEGDKLKAIYPKKTYGSLTGTDLRDLSYSYTLAKVVKDDVIAGPEQLTLTQEHVFLFIRPIIKGNQYKGEIVAAVNRDYILENFGLQLLSEGGYDYEVWKVNSLGEKKKVIEVSDTAIDFSDAVKQEFSLPATWNLSVIPQDGWLADSVKLIIDISCFVGALLILLLAYLLLRIVQQKKELRMTAYTDPESGMLSREGFCYFVNKAKYMKTDETVTVLYIQLHNFHRMCGSISREEIQEYLRMIQKELKERFPEDCIAGHLSEEEIAVAIFKDTEDVKVKEAIEDFILQLFWKKKLHGKKEFVEPKSCIVCSPANKTSAEELLKNAAMRLNELYDLQASADE